MPRPSQVHQDAALEKISVSYMPQGLIAQEFPMVPVIHESDKYYVWSKDNLRVPSTIWADNDYPNRSVWNLSTASYNLERHALSDFVSDRTKKNADKAIRPEIDMTEGLTGQIKLRKEISLLTAIQTAANFAQTTSLSSTQVWTADTTLSNPITFIDSATTSIRRRSGKIANTVVLRDGSFKAAKEHKSIVDRIKYTSAESVSPAMLANLFSVDRVLVSGSVQNTAEENLADDLSDIATDTAFIGYLERAPGLRKASAVYSFVQNGGTQPFKVMKSRDDRMGGGGVWIDVSTFYQHKIVSSDCAYLIVNTE